MSIDKKQLLESALNGIVNRFSNVAVTDETSYRDLFVAYDNLKNIYENATEQNVSWTSDSSHCGVWCEFIRTDEVSNFHGTFDSEILWPESLTYNMMIMSLLGGFFSKDPFLEDIYSNFPYLGFRRPPSKFFFGDNTHLIKSTDSIVYGTLGEYARKYISPVKHLVIPITNTLDSEVAIVNNIVGTDRVQLLVRNGSPVSRRISMPGMYMISAHGLSDSDAETSTLESFQVETLATMLAPTRGFRFSNIWSGITPKFTFPARATVYIVVSIPGEFDVEQDNQVRWNYSAVMYNFNALINNTNGLRINQNAIDLLMSGGAGTSWKGLFSNLSNK